MSCTMLKLKVRYCGVLEQACGGAEGELEIVQLPVRVSDVLTRVAAENPAAREYLPAVACAIGDEIVARDHCLSAGQTLVLLPPVSGG